MTTALLEVDAVHKRYGGAVALRGAALTLSAAGQVHCLAGENGSGKSTMLGVISGTVAPDAGRLLVDGRPVAFRTPFTALQHGIAMVSQETTIAPDLSVTENILLGRRLVRRRGGIDWRASRSRAKDVLARLELDYDPDATVGSLAPHERQMVEIARALSFDARILILDEPTSSLMRDDVGALMATIRRLAASGVSIVFVSHRLPEVFEICDSVTVLRDGVTVTSGPLADFTPETLVSAMIGERGRTAPEPRQRSATLTSATTALSVSGLSVSGVLEDINLEVARGEIVGVAGMVASGRSELLEAIFGARAIDTGEITVNGHRYVPRGPRAAIDVGIGFLPPDRKTQGLVLSMSARDNLLLAATGGVPSWRAPDRRRREREWQSASKTMRIRTSSPQAAVGALSGGNQQKVALGKWLACDTTVLLLDEPTRGVDVGAKAEIYSWLRGPTGSNLGIVVSSSEYEELLKLCDRVIVLLGGRMVADLVASDTSESDLAAIAGGRV